jgi:ATP-dependent helicase/nuclease subunit A
LKPGASGARTGDADDRALIVEALDETLVVEAAAGTGKTTELVKRIVRLVETGRASIEQIVAVTFSEKAAGELKLRLREALERARVSATLDETATHRLERAVQRFEEAHVSTIHGFCADLLRERPVEARIDPSFQVLTEGQAARIFDEAFSDWLQGELANPGPGLKRSLRRETIRRWRRDEDENGPIDRLKRAGAELLEWRDHPARWRRPDDFDRDAQIDSLLDAITAFAALSKAPTNRSDPLFKKTQEIRRVHAEVHQLRARGITDYDGWESRLCALAAMARDLREGRSTSGRYSRTVPRLAVCQARDLVVDALVAFRDRADADLAALVRDELQGAIARYEERKRRTGVVDFLDLLIHARNLVRDRPDVRRDFQQRFRYLLVDEFQDTDPLQAELLLLLAAREDAYGGPSLHARPNRVAPIAAEAEAAGYVGAGLQAGPYLAESEARPLRTRPGALFIVGDPKQSIYRFRRADVGVYRAICERLVAEGARCVRLRTSFRSVPAIQRAVNAAFSTHMTGDEQALQARYVELQPDRHDALPVPMPYGVRSVTATAITACLPEAVGEFVRWLVHDSGWTVVGEHRARRPIRAGDVCLLFRRFLDYQEDVTRAYVDALESRGLTHLLVGGKAFHEREEVDALRTALTAIEWPDDALSVFATLRGPFFAVGEEELLAWHALGHGFRPYHGPEGVPAVLQTVADALGVLRELNRLRNHRPVADTIGRLMEATRAHAGFALWPGGEQVLANVLQIAELARQYEAEGGLSFRGFVGQLREAADRTVTPEAPILEEGTDGVRLMTVHKAKGLEFPIVILADIGCRLSRDEAQRHLDSARGLAAVKLAGWTPLDLRANNTLEAARDEAEGVRLAYVAATRARDLLVVPAVGDGPHEKSWVHPLSAAIYPPVDREEGQGFSPGQTQGGSQTQGRSQTQGGSKDPPPQSVFGLPPFKGKDTVLDRPDGESPSFTTVRPGVYQCTDPVTKQPYTVVWWDPLLLDRTGEERRGLRREDLIAKEARADLVAEDRARYDSWREWKHQTIAHGERPSIRVATVSEYIRAVAAAVDPIAASVEVIDLGLAEPRPSGRRFGILVHALLAAVPLDALSQEVSAFAVLHARLLGATEEERAAAALTADRALRHRLLDRARAAEAAGRVCRREVELSLVRDGTVIDGQADLVWDDGDRWMVADFKTDVEISSDEETYRRQVALYIEAITRATGRAASGVLLRV